MDERWQQIQDLFDEVVELEPGAQEARLAAVAQADPELARKARSLLAAYAQRDDVLGLFEELPALPPPAAAGTGLQEGATIGPYRILRQIGRGGMAVVYLATRRDFKKLVALKLIRRGMDSEEILQRFRNERQILAALIHPGIARLLDAGQTEDGLPYFVMEYVEGVPIDQYCDRHRLSITERLNLFRTVCQAVQYAHQNLVVHRDLKPGNILVTKTGEVRLLDFGIAKVLNPALAHIAVTRAGLRLMTPEYASPEQVVGEPITTASDVYSLGVLLYELLTGRRPYQLKGHGSHALAQEIAEAEPRRPSTAVTEVVEVVRGDGTTRTITPEQVSQARNTQADRLKRRLRGDLDTIVLMALRKEPWRRYGSAAELAEDVRRHLASLPIVARGDTMGYRVQKFVQRHRMGVVAVCLVALALLGGLGVALWQARVAAAERDIAQHERDRAEQAASRAEQVTEFLVRVFEVSNASASRGDTLTALEVLDRGAAWIGNETGEDVEIEAAMMDVLGRIYRNLGRFDDATPFLERALALRRQAHEGAHPEVAQSLHYLGGLHQTRGHYQAAEQLLQEALAMRQTLWQGDHPDIASTLTHLSYVMGELGDDPATERLRRESLAMRRRLWGAEHPDVAQALNDLAVQLDKMGVYEEAEALLREAVAIRQKAHGPKTLSVAISLSNLGLVLQNKGAVEEAVHLQRESVAIRRAIVGENHPTLAIGLRKLALAYFFKGAYEDAAEHYEEALRLFRVAYPQGNLRIAQVLAGWGEVRLAQGRTDEAEAMLREALAFYTENYGDLHWRTAGVKSALGACLARQGRYGEAEAELQDAWPYLRETFSASHVLNRTIRQRLADLYQAWGKPEQASVYRGTAGGS